MSRILIVTANPLLDCIHDAAITPGAVTRSSGMHITAGGKGINVGRVLHAHGHQVIATGFAGGWSGSAFRELVRNEGQQDAFIACAARLRIGFMAQDCADAGATALLENGFHISRDECRALIDMVRHHINTCDLVIISGSVPHMHGEQLFADILDVCATALRPCPCWIDSYGAAMETALRHHHPPQLVTPNRQEYLRSPAALWANIDELHITDGAQHSDIHIGQQHYHVHSPQIDCVNAIGSGDAYLGALAHARLSAAANVNVGVGVNDFMTPQQQLCYAAAAGTCNAAQMAVADIAPSAIRACATQIRCEDQQKEP